MTTGTDAVLKERGQRYGSFETHAEVSQTLKAIFKSKMGAKWDYMADDQRESLEMIAHKLGRIINGDPGYGDSWRDIAGYAQLVADRLEGVKAESLNLPVIEMPEPVVTKEEKEALNDPHSELRKTWRAGQLWESRKIGGVKWYPVQNPVWSADQEYRRSPDCTWTDPEESKSADPHAELKAIYRPGMRLRTKHKHGHGNWGGWDVPNPLWGADYDYEIHPDDLPKPESDQKKPWYPDDSGEWVEVPDDLMGMPEELWHDTLVEVLRADERANKDFTSYADRAFGWDWSQYHGNRIVAYKVVKP